MDKTNLRSKCRIGKHYSIRTEFKKGHKETEEIREKRINALKGRKFSDKTKEIMRIKNLGINNPMYGKHLSDEHKKKMSISLKKSAKDNPNYGMRNKHRSKELIMLSKGKHYSPNTEFKKGEPSWNKGKKDIYSKETIGKIKKARAKQIIPVKDTSIEIKIQNFLTELNIPFLKHQYMEIEHGYQCDILIPTMNLIIEVDGDWWHGNPKIFPNPNEMQLEQIEEDKIRTQELIEKGFKVLRLWECDIKVMKLNEFKRTVQFGWLIK